MNRIKLEDLSIVAKIGEGATTTVHKAVENSTGKYYAVKMMPLNKNTSQKYREQLLAEVETQQSLNHPNIIRCHGSFEKNDTIYVVLELAPDGDLYSILSGRLTEDKIRTIFKEIVSAVKFIHEKGIVHRDIKPENILVNWEGNFKLGDFGWACRHTDCEAAGGHAGTLEYMSPECLNRQRHSFPTDIWSLGVLLYELFHNKEPFEGENAAQLAAAIHSPLSFSDRVGPDAKDLIRSCLKADPVERPTIQQIASHHFLNPYSREPSASDSLSPARKSSNRINRSSSQLTLLPEAQNSNTQKIQVQPANPSRTILSKSFFAQQTPTVLQQEGHLRQSSTQLQNVFSQPQNRVNTDLAPTNPRTYQQALTMPERTLIRPSAAPLQTSSSSLNLHHPQPNYLNSRITLARNPLHSASVRQLLPNHQGTSIPVPQRNEVSNLKSLTQEIPKKYFVKREAQTYSTPISSSYKPFFVPPQLQPRNLSTTAENLKPSLIHTAYQSQNISTAHQPVKANLPAHYSMGTYLQNEVRYNRPVYTQIAQRTPVHSFGNSNASDRPRKMLTLKSSRTLIS